MLLSLFLRNTVVCGCAAALLTGAAYGQAGHSASGGEYLLTAPMPGDQVHPHLGVKASGGFLVWQDNVTDGDDWGISALRLDGNMSPLLSPFRVNSAGAGAQEFPQAAALENGGAAFVWQGGPAGFQHIYARFLAPDGTWTSGNDLALADPNTYQLRPAVTALRGGKAVVVWSSVNQRQADSMQDVYGQLLSPAGEKIGAEFAVNQFATFNQRTPAIAALNGGGFVVVWVSEQQRKLAPVSSDFEYLPGSQPSVDIYGRLYDGNGVAVTGEFLVNTSSNTCANPSVAAGLEGGFVVSWGERDPNVRQQVWDIYARVFTSPTQASAPVRVNTWILGDQVDPQIAGAGSEYLCTWMSLGQDGSKEGVFGQFIKADGTLAGSEFRVTTTFMASQMHPTLAADGAGGFVAAWTCFFGDARSFDLMAQRYATDERPLEPMGAPFVHVPFEVGDSGYQPQLSVSWPVQAGLDVDHYEIYVDGSVSAAASVNGDTWLMTASEGLTANSSHSFQVAYVTQDGRRSPKSAAVTGKTWSGYNWGGVPFEWMTAHFGSDMSTWPRANAVVAPGAPTVSQLFLTGASPSDPATWLTTRLVSTEQGWFLQWNCQPGLKYQVQTSVDLSNWTNVGGARFAAGAQDSLFVGAGQVGYFRVLRLR